MMARKRELVVLLLVRFTCCNPGAWPGNDSGPLLGVEAWGPGKSINGCN